MVWNMLAEQVLIVKMYQLIFYFFFILINFVLWSSVADAGYIVY